MWWMLVGLALAGKWDDAETDVQVVRTVDASREEVWAAVADLRSYRARFPEDCAKDWVVYEPTTGVHAEIDAKYTFGPLKRKLTAVITKETEPQLWQLEHKGPRGWFTQFRLAEADGGGTEVTMLTPINAPWPFRGVFHKKVRPAMIACYERVLEQLAGDLG